MKTKERSTKDKLLDAAEALFADEGIQATSLRRITEKAGTNLAAVNYHFRSKEALIEAVFARRLIPINEERLRLLDRVEAAGGNPSLEEALRAFFVPEVRMWIDSPRFARLAGRLQYEPDAMLHRFFLAQFEEVIRRFDVAITRAVPEVSREELFWRMGFLIGAMDHTWACPYLEGATGGICKIEDPYEVLDRLIAFGAAGLRAPVPGGREESR